jgi:hypothetical protein
VSRSARTIWLSLVVLASALAASPAAAFVPVTCGGLVVTIAGTDGDDLLWGTMGPDVIHAGPGDDVVFGLGGDDVVCGGPGEDVLYGGTEDDHLIGGTDPDLLDLQPDRRGAPQDTVVGGPGADRCDGAYERHTCEERGPFLRPHDSPVTWVFELRLHPIYRDYRWHNGWDFGGECGDPLRAPADGLVILAGWKDEAAGNAVRIDHGDGIVSAHAHLTEVWVEVGDPVEMGQVFGLVGETGAATECHLHAEIHLDGDRIDPIPYWCPGRYFRAGMEAGVECPIEE